VWILFRLSTETRNIPINWELLEKNRNEKTTTKKRNLPLATLVRIRGPPKVVDGFSNFNVNKSEQYPHVCTQIDIGTLGRLLTLISVESKLLLPRAVLVLLKDMAVFGP
jgi:hypothetical protein